MCHINSNVSPINLDMHTVQFLTDVTFKKAMFKRKFSNHILLKNSKVDIKLYSNIYHNIPLSFLVPSIHRRLSFFKAQETHHSSSPCLTSVTSFSLTTLHIHKRCTPDRLFSEELVVPLRRVKCLLFSLSPWLSVERTPITSPFTVPQGFENLKCYIVLVVTDPVIYVQLFYYIWKIPQLDVKVLKIMD